MASLGVLETVALFDERTRKRPSDTSEDNPQPDMQLANPLPKDTKESTLSWPCIGLHSLKTEFSSRVGYLRSVCFLILKINRVFHFDVRVLVLNL